MTFLEPQAGCKRRFHIHPLMTQTQSFKCWAGYILKQKGDVRGHFSVVSKGVSETWMEEGIALYKAFALSSLEGRVPITRRTGQEEMYRFFVANFANLPFIPSFRQMLLWAVQSGSHVPKRFSTPGSGRGYNRAMSEAEWKCMIDPKGVTAADIDDLFFNTGYKHRYTDPASPPLEADAGALGRIFAVGGSRPDPVNAAIAAYANLSFQQAMDMSNATQAEQRSAAREALDEDLDATGTTGRRADAGKSIFS